MHHKQVTLVLRLVRPARQLIMLLWSNVHASDFHSILRMKLSKVLRF